MADDNFDDGDDLDYYHDDPDQEINDKPDRKKNIVIGFCASVVLIISAIFYLPSSIGGKITINTGADKDFGLGVSARTACSGNTSLLLKPGTRFLNSEGGSDFYISSVRVSNIPLSCKGSDFTISAYGPTSDTPIALYDGTSTDLLVSFGDETLSWAGGASSDISFIGTTDCLWKEQKNSPSTNWSKISSSSDGVKLAATRYSGRIWTSTDCGKNWAEKPISKTDSSTRDWISIASSSDGQKLAAVSTGTSGGQCYLSTNGGEAWTACRASNPSSGGLYVANAMSLNGNKIVQMIQSEYFYYSSDAGVTFTRSLNNQKKAFQAAAVSDSNFAVVVFGGSIYTTTGSTTGNLEDFARSSAGSKNWRSITMSSDGTKLAAVADGANIWTSANSGVDWTERTASGSRKWVSIASTSDGNNLVAAVSGGYIYRSLDQGATWSPITEAGSRLWTSVALAADGDQLEATTSDGSIYGGKLFVSFTVTFNNPVAKIKAYEKFVIKSSISD